MGTLSERKLIEILMEIQSDIRQIKYDVQLLLKQQPRLRTRIPRTAMTRRSSLRPPGQPRLKTFFGIFVRSGETTIWEPISAISRIYCRNEVRRSNPEAIVAALESGHLCEK